MKSADHTHKAQRLDGREVANRLLAALRETVSESVASGARPPGLAVVLVGDDAASEVYVNHKVRACAQVGIHSMAHHLPATVSQSELLGLIDALNADESVDGILVQLPLPGELDGLLVTRRISPAKDVDGFHPVNMGLLAQRTPKIRRCHLAKRLWLEPQIKKCARRRSFQHRGTASDVGASLGRRYSDHRSSFYGESRRAREPS